MAGEPDGGVKIESREDFEAWLDKRKPRKEICVALAARAALRALPLVARDIPERSDQDEARRFLRLCAALFRATALARVAAKYPTRANDLRAAAAATAATAAYAAAATAAYAAAAAATAAAYAADAAADAAARAAAAAYAAAAAAAYAADDASFWRALAVDVSNVESGQSSRDLADAPLWPEAPPTVVADNWRALAAALPDSDGWAVWKHWYVARLNGEPWSEARELVFATVPVEKWDEGPVAANAWIAERLGELDPPSHEKGDPPPVTETGIPTIPAPRPATVEPVIRDGKIALPLESAAIDLDGDAFKAALDALRSMMSKLADDLAGEANIDPRAIVFLRDLSESVPVESPTQAQLFEFAHHQETLEDYGKKVVAEWPDLLASRYLGVGRAFDRTMRQSPKWRLLKQNALKDRLTDEQRANAPMLAREFASALREAGAAEHVDNAIPEVIEGMAKQLEPAADFLPREFDADTRPEDLIASVDNTLKAIGDAAMQADSETRREKKPGYGTQLASGFTGYVRDGKKVGEDMGKWAIRALVTAGGGAAIYQLMTHYPTIAQWLRPIIDHLSR